MTDKILVPTQGKTMDAELKTKWVAALRSGKYQQAKSCLRDLDETNLKVVRFCCLGVLIDIQGAKWIADNPKINGKKANHSRGGWVSEEFSGGLLLRDQERLSDMNDSGANFSKIADHIEKSL